MQVLTGLVSSTFQDTLTFLQNEGMNGANYNVSQRTIANNRCAPGIVEVSNFLNILSACLDKNFLRDELERQLAEDEAVNPNTPEPSLSKAINPLR